MAAVLGSSGLLQAQQPASLVRMALSDEASERSPVLVPCEPTGSTEVDFPWPLLDWAGRGFTPDPQKFEGDFVIEAARGQSRIFVTPRGEGAHRVLHVILAASDAKARSITLEFVPAPASLAWRKLDLLDPSPSDGAPPAASLSEDPPEPPTRAPSPDSELGLLRTLRLIAGAPRSLADSLVRQNPALRLVRLTEPPRSFADFSLQPVFSLLDTTTGALGIYARVSNRTNRLLLFDPKSWVVRVGERVYPALTVDFVGSVAPAAEAPVFLVLTGEPDAGPSRLQADNAFELSAVVAQTASARPVSLSALAGFDPR